MRKPCIYCGDMRHTKSMCFKKPRKPPKPRVYKLYKPMRAVSKKTAKKKRDFDAEWYEENPPNEDGLWECYLRITPDCEIMVDRHTINLEHKLSKTRHPGLKYVLSNVGPACQPCNKLKGSKDWDDERHILI